MAANGGASNGVCQGFNNGLSERAAAGRFAGCAGFAAFFVAMGFDFAIFVFAMFTFAKGGMPLSVPRDRGRLSARSPSCDVIK